MVGGDGAIYAIRRSLWQTLPERRHQRLPESPADRRSRMARRVRTGSGLLGGDRGRCGPRVPPPGPDRQPQLARRVPGAGVLNPFRVGLFAWSLVSHKVLRWLSGLFALVAVFAGAVELVRALEAEPVLTLSVIAASATALMLTRWGRHMVPMTAYVATIYAASIVGVVKGSIGQVSGVWTTPRQPARPRRRQRGCCLSVW